MVQDFWREVCVQTEAFDMAHECQRIQEHAANVGALVSFQGMVREFNAASDTHNPIQALYLEHFAGVTEAEIERIIVQAGERWPILAAQVIHRVGMLYAHDPIVLVNVCAEHRAAAFAAAQFIMDYLKTEAPFWKREHHADGAEHWVAAKASDQAALAQWEKPI